MRTVVKNSLRKSKRFVESVFDVKITRNSNKVDLSMYGAKGKGQKPLYLNIGAGNWEHPMWHNLDNPVEGYDKSLQAQKAQSRFIGHNLMTHDQVAIESNSLELIFCSHTIEHLNDKYADLLLAECFRMLKPGGRVRITCPDITLFVDAYNRKDSEYLASCNNMKLGQYSNEQLFIYVFGSALSEISKDCGVKKVSDQEFIQLVEKEGGDLYKVMDQLLERIPDSSTESFPRNHDSYWTEKKMIESLSSKGFSNVYESRYGQSQSVMMRDLSFFDYTHPYESLYIEAVK